MSDEWKGTDFNDPLNDILLPAYSLAKKTQHGERAVRSSERLLSAAVLVLVSEREAMRMLYRGALEQIDERESYIAELRAECPAEVLVRVSGHRRLVNKDLKAAAS